MIVRIEGKWSGLTGSAVQWNGHNIDECSQLADDELHAEGQILTVMDDEGVAPLVPGDWLIKADEKPWLVSCYNQLFPQLFRVVE